MIELGIFLLIVGLVALALDRTVPASHPVSTFVMYLGIGLGLILLVIGLLAYLTQGGSVEVDSSGGITVR